ncbi:MAG: 16S rRNA (guanine(966)-N(2))-methyltransferase RsmD [Bacilli bacterium]|jgi:16S rRNA (guanine(966)-N(2))-methyltransferase RsmD|nr:16S rRNA (guanine(966)-N(2))-methyltransferase RsmD [Bacilli bacterium]
MQISRGKFRGLKLNTLSGLNTRPTTQKVKEAIFNMIAFDVADSIVLDMFSGSGALGIECLSMDAKEVFFNDKSKEALKVINSNLNKLKINNYQTFNLEYNKLINLLNLNNNSFDLIILDPPYHLKIIDELIKLIIDNNLLNKNGIIVAELSFEENINDSYDMIYLIKDKKYGKTRIAIYKYDMKEE